MLSVSTLLCRKGIKKYLMMNQILGSPENVPQQQSEVAALEPKFQENLHMLLVIVMN
jgi:hypothetical protein